MQHRRPTYQRISSLNSFAVSLVIHLAVVIGLALSVYQQLGTQGFALFTSFQETAEAELELPPTLAPPVIATTDDEAPQLSTSSLVNAEVTLDARMFQGDGDLGAVVATAASATRSLQDAKDRLGGASFYGIEASGNKFVYVVDSSTSMEGKRWNSARQELIRSLNQLNDNQQFFVICFDLEARPIFGHFPPKNEFIEGSDRNISKVKNWLKQIELGHSTRPANALAMAIDMKPDAIYLLSDGEIRDHSILMLQQKNRDGEGNVVVPIHTISLFSTEGRYTLMEIARQNKGNFSSKD